MSRTTLALALVVAAMPALAGAQSSTGTQQQDSTRRGNSGQSSAGQQTSGQRGSGNSRDAQGSRRTSQSRGGEVSRGNNGGSGQWRGRNYGLNQDQILQLQQAIDDRTQCDVGTADGIMGPKTRRALTCARKELGIEGNDMGELFSALDLDFANDQGGQDMNGNNGQGNNGNRGTMGNSGNSGNAGNRGTTGNSGNSGNRGNNGRDSTMRDSSRGQQPPGQQPPR